MTGASIEADGRNRTWEQGTVSGVASLCSCLTHPRECAPGASGCVAGQPDWQRTVTETGSASNASLVLVMRLLQLVRSRLRVYRYALPSGATKPRDMSYNKGYSLEGAFDERLRSSQLLTSDATRANLFYLPIHPIGCHMQKVDPRRAGIRANLRSVGSCAEEAARIMRQVGAAGPYLAADKLAAIVDGASLRAAGKMNDFARRVHASGRRAPRDVVSRPVWRRVA